MRINFPKNFWWGVGYSSHQVEGNNTNNDWWEWEQKGKTKDKSGWACDSWNRYPIDHALAGELGCNSFRLSLEWAKIQPEEGEFSSAALEHYRNLLKDLKVRGIRRVVTLWHYTVPIWFARKYGWDKKESIELFVQYFDKIITTLGAEIDMIQTMNEPRLPLNRGYILGNRPPGRRNPIAYLKARKNMVEAHKRCYLLAKKKKIKIPIGITQFCNDFEYSGRLKTAYRIIERIENFYNWYFFDEIGQFQDYIGINYYFGVKVRLGYPLVEKLTHENKTTDMGWGIYPEGLREVIMDASERYHKPIYILENGIADKTDKQRQCFIKDHLHEIHKAIIDGADVRGYFYWSLIDNFEWEDGFDYRFGLCHTDYKTMKRSPRPSYYYYQKIIKENGIEI